MNERDFSRNRKLSFPSTLLLMMNFLKRSLSLEIEDFISFLSKKADGLPLIKQFTKSAFVQGRKKIAPEVFKRLSSVLTDEFYNDNPEGVKTWNGLRLLAVDGSFITLPKTKELEAVYGQTKNQTELYVVQAAASVLYDVLNLYAIDGILTTKDIGERKLALGHLDCCNKGDLVIYDRGYPSYDLIYEHYKRELNFLIRVRSDFNTAAKVFLESGKHSQIIEIFTGLKSTDLLDKEYAGKTPLTVRIIRVELPGGEVELLISSLLDNKKFKTKCFKELYFKRWKVETFYDELKNKLKVEHFSGYSNQSILQDFYAALFVSNIQTLIVGELQDELDQEPQGGKYNYKVNASLSYGFMKNRIIDLFFSKQNMEDIIKELKVLFKKHMIPIRPNRSNKREIAKYKRRERPKVMKNYKDTI